MRNKLSIFLASILVSLSCQAHICIVNTNKSIVFPSLQAAIEHAADGDTIEVSEDIWQISNFDQIDLMNKNIIIKSENSENNNYFCSAGFISNINPSAVKNNSACVPDQLIVKLKKVSAQNLATQLSNGKNGNELQMTGALGNLNKKHNLRKIRPLFRNFEKKQRQIENLQQKNTLSLTQREKHILQRLKRAPVNVNIPNLDRIYIFNFDPNDTSSSSLQQILSEYRANPQIEYAELNYIVSADTIPNDPLYPVQWPLDNIGQLYPASGRYTLPPGTPDCDIDAPQAWDMNIGNDEAIVTVLDTGVDYTHRDLVSRIWINADEFNGSGGVDDDNNGYIDDIYGYDFINSDGNPKDDYGHGTHCAGVIGAATNNGYDIAGVCSSAKIMGLKFLGANGSGPISAAIEAFYYAVDMGTDVISNSWGGGDFTQSAQDAIDYAYSQGVVVVASAGNKNNTIPQYPAYYNHVISVAATDSDDHRATFSTYGSWVDIAAPGVDVLSLRASGTSMGTAYNSFTTIASGTSMACPHVSGAAAMLFNLDPALFVDRIETLLKTTADTIASGICQSGRLNLNNMAGSVITSAGKIRLGRDFYRCSDTIIIELRDRDLTGNSTQTVTFITDAGDLETLTLTEHQDQAGFFAGQITTAEKSAIPEDGILDVSHGLTITAVYEDADDGTGHSATAYDNADVDCQAPSAVNIEVISLTSRTATIRVETDESTTVQFRAGATCGGPYTILRTSKNGGNVHTIELKPLASATTFYYILDITDQAGNVVTEDNAGECYSFTTPEFLGFGVPSVYPTIQAAINAAWNGDEVIVEDGIYTGPGNRDIDFGGLQITVRSENGPENCIIDCENAGRGFNFQNGETTNAVLDGFTIINGNAAEGGGIRCAGLKVNNACVVTQPTIRSCIIRYCVSSGNGAIGCIDHAFPVILDCFITDNMSIGIYGKLTSGPQITNCIIESNNGDGIYLWECGTNPPPKIDHCTIFNNNGCGFNGSSNSIINNCTISGNASYGIYTAYYSVIISNSTIKNNNAGIYFRSIDPSTALVDGCTISDNNGCGIYSDISPTNIQNCIISNNKSSGIYSFYRNITVSKCFVVNNKNSGISYSSCGIQATDSLIVGNTTSTQGGGLCGFWDAGTILKNCVIMNNTAVTRGGGIWSNPSSSYTIQYINSTIINNTAGEMGGGLSLGSYTASISNCILWGNTAPLGPQIAVHSAACSSNISYSDVQGGLSSVYYLYGGTLTWGTGNINSSPLLSLSGDYHLLGGSPCIDTGTNSPTGGLPVMDLYGRNRILDGNNDGSLIADMGAYEFEYASQTPVIAINRDFFEFYNYNGQPNPLDQTFSIRNAGGGTLNWHIDSDSFWLKTSPSDGSSAGQTNTPAIQVDTTTLSHGEYTGILTIFDSDAINNPRTIRIKLYIADDIYVPDDYPTIQAAIDAVGDKSTIVIKDGTYTGSGNRNISFLGKAITVRSQNGPEHCIINCESAGRGFILNSYEGNDSVLEGVTILGGSSTGYGAGIYCDSSGPTIINCTISGCRTTGIFGGGFYCESGNPVIRNCTFSSNQSKDRGGGVYLNKNTPALIENCVFISNTANDGAGIGFMNDDGYFATIRNCLFLNNSASVNQGTIYLTSTSTKLYNCTLVNNTAGATGLGGGIHFYCSTSRTPALKNSILWGNTPAQIYEEMYTIPAILYNDIQGGHSGTGNIAVNPNFVNLLAGDYHLRWNSPCVNRGDPAYSAGDNEYDIDGESRITSGRIDMGCDETGPKQADFTRNGRINTEDLLIFTETWLSHAGDSNWYILCDLQEDGNINLSDLAEFSRDWLWHK